MVENGIITNLDYILTQDGVRGDLQQVFKDQFDASDGYVAMDKGWYFTQADINPMSKCKPFASSKLIFETQQQRDNAARQIRYGFGSSRVSAGYTFSYHKPLGLNNNEPWRILDFNGYYHNSPCPFKIEAQVRKGTGHYVSAKGYISIKLSVNSAASSDWNSTYSMGIHDFFNTNTQADTDALWNYYSIAFKLENKSRSSSCNPTVIVTNKTLEQVFSASNEAYFVFPEVTQEQWNYLELLDGAALEDNFEVMVYLNNPVSLQTGRDYAIYTGSDANIWTAGFSLALQQGVDRAIVAVQSVYTMLGTVGNIINVDIQNNGIISPFISGLDARKFTLQLNLHIDTTAARSNWSMLPLGLPVKLIMEFKRLSVSYGETLFAPDDNNIEHSSWLTTYTEDDCLVYRWEDEFNLGYNISLDFSRNPISHSKEIEPHVYASDYDRLFLCKSTSEETCATFEMRAKLKFGSEEVDLGSSQQYTVYYDI